MQTFDFSQSIIYGFLTVFSAGPLIGDISLRVDAVGKVNEIRKEVKMLRGEMNSLFGIAPSHYPARAVIGHDAVGEGMDAADDSFVQPIGYFELRLYDASILHLNRSAQSVHTGIALNGR